MPWRKLLAEEAERARSQGCWARLQAKLKASRVCFLHACAAPKELATPKA